ncbi:uncharacterized protein [Halyomorpha halys]|uniref:uncharacterized protein n=1 Tax=Halyomorpha halys TaxID=286706 RepID=UPI0006D50694|nr:uncharacterized protein LOC106683378 [Halyomorpha halys]
MPFDTQKFIEEVFARPVLWNNAEPEFANKAYKGRIWKELCNIFVPNYRALDSAARNREAIGLQKKWKSLRDSFNRELKARRLDMPGTSDQGRKTCTYYEELSFLKPVLEAKKRDAPQVSSATTEQEHSRSEQEVPVHGTPCKRKRSDPPPPDDDGSNSVDESNGSTEEDLDTLFFHSMLPDFKRLPPSCKFNLKLTFLKLIKKYKMNNAGIPLPAGGSSRTTPRIPTSRTGCAVLEGSSTYREVSHEEPEELHLVPVGPNQDEDENDLEELVVSDTSPGLSTGYTDESASPED